MARLSGLGKPSFERDESDDVQLEVVSSPHEGIVNDIKAHITSLGGLTIFTYKIVRLLGCLVLVALTIATLIVNDYHNTTGSSILDALKKHKGKKKSKSKKPSETFSQSEWLQIALCLAYVRNQQIQTESISEIFVGLHVSVSSYIGHCEAALGSCREQASGNCVAFHLRYLCVPRRLASGNVHSRPHGSC